MIRRPLRRPMTGAGALVAFLLFSLLAAVPARAEQDAPPEGDGERIAFDVPRLPLTNALLLLSDQAGVQLLADPALISDVQSQAMSGRYTIAEVLDRLLDDTGLGWRYLASRTITIERATPPVPSAAAPPVRTLSPVRIVGQRPSWPLADGGSTDMTATQDMAATAAGYARVASKIARPLAQTPQSVSVLTHRQLAEQNLTDVPEALQNMPGVSGRMVDGISGWTFLSRGFEIHSFSFDGGGPSFYHSPIDADVRSLLDTPELAEFDHIEIMRGAAGVFGGVSYPGGVINFQRKRPLDHLRLDTALQLGSWNNRRIEADASLPIAFDGRLRARVVGLNQSRDFFHGVTHEDRSFGYGMLEAEIGSKLLIRGGGSYRDLSRPGFNAAGLPRYPDGSSLEIGRATCLCPESNQYVSLQSELFFSGEWKFASNWQLMVNGTWRSQDKDFSVKIAAAAFLQKDGISVYQILGNDYSAQNNFTSSVVAIAGEQEISGRTLNFIAGFDYMINKSYTINDIGTYGSVIAVVPDVDLVKVLEKADRLIGSSTLSGQRVRVAQFGPFARLSMPLTPRVNVDVGFRKSFYHLQNSPPVGDDVTSGAVRFMIADKMTFRSSVLPTLSASYRIDPDFSVHLNYVRIFKPQVRLAADGRVLPSARGATYEAKMAWFDRAHDLSASLAVYYQKVLDLGVPSPLPAMVAGCCHETARHAQSHGLDAEFAGTLLPGWRLNLAYNWTRSRARSSAGSDAINRQQPAHRATLWTSYGPGPWSIGAGARFESRREAKAVPCDAAINASDFCLSNDMPETLSGSRFVEAPYVVADLRLARKLGEHVEVAFNMTNIFDKRYYATVSLPSMGNYFGEPRAFMVTLRANAAR